MPIPIDRVEVQRLLAEEAAQLVEVLPEAASAEPTCRVLVTRSDAALVGALRREDVSRPG